MTQMNNGKDKSKQKRNKKTENAGFIYIGSVGGFWFFLKADTPLKELNLGQLNRGIPKYLCENDFGKNTGSGQAFEDVFYKICKANGADISKVAETKNGADFMFNGEPVQLKYGRSARSIFNKLFDKKTGEYRYPGQKLITNEENVAELRELFELNKDRLKGIEVEVNPVGTPVITSEEVNAQLHRGFESMKIDARDILSNSNAQKNIAIGLIASFCVVIGIGAIVEYNKQKKEADNAKKKSKFKRAGEAVNNSLKKHWKKGLISSLIAGLTIFGGKLIQYQLRRPK